MDNIKETNCPGCERHCPAASLSCNWGRNHFGIEPIEEKKPMTWAEKRRMAKAKSSISLEK